METKQKITWLFFGAIVGGALVYAVMFTQRHNGKPAFIQGGADAITRDQPNP